MRRRISSCNLRCHTNKEKDEAVANTTTNVSTDIKASDGIEKKNYYCLNFLSNKPFFVNISNDERLFLQVSYILQVNTYFGIS